MQFSKKIMQKKISVFFALSFFYYFLYHVTISQSFLQYVDYSTLDQYNIHQDHIG